MPGPRIVLLRTKDSANVGATARAMLNFGLSELWLVAPRCRIDHRAYALASHAEEVLKEARVVDDLEQAIAGTTLVAGTSARTRAADNYVVRSPREAAPMLTDSSAVLFGPEDHGLSNEELTRCQLQIVIPTADFSSLNLAQAVLVMAYEVHLATRAAGGQGAGTEAEGPDAVPAAVPVDAARASAVDPHGAPGDAAGSELATRDQVERFYAQLEKTLLLIGYTDPPRAPGVMRLYRAMLDRARLSPHELAALRGFASQIDWAASQPPEMLPGSRDSELEQHPGPRDSEFDQLPGSRDSERLGEDGGG